VVHGPLLAGNLSPRESAYRRALSGPRCAPRSALRAPRPLASSPGCAVDFLRGDRDAHRPRSPTCSQTSSSIFEGNLPPGRRHGFDNEGDGWHAADRERDDYPTRHVVTSEDDDPLDMSAKEAFALMVAIANAHPLDEDDREG